MLLLIAGSVIAVAAIAVAVVIVVRTDNDDSGGQAFVDADPADAVTVAVPGDYEIAEVGDVRVSLPPSWVWARLDQGHEGLGAQLAPGDPEIARNIDDLRRTQPRSTVLLGLDESNLRPRQFNTHVVVMELPTMESDDVEELRADLAEEMDRAGSNVSSVSYITSREGPAIRVRFRTQRQRGTVEYLQYWYATPEGPYTLSLGSERLDDYVEVADAMAASFDTDPTT